MTEELEQLLKNLKLKRILEIYDEQLRAADKDDISYSEFVTRLVRAQYQARQEGALEWRIQRAKLPERWTLETFPFARQPGVNRKQIRGFGELEFIAKAENIVFIGETARLPGGPARGVCLAGDEHQRQREVIRDAFRTQIADDGETLAPRIVGAQPELDALLEHDGKRAVAEFRRILKAEIDRSDLNLGAGFPDEAAAENVWMQGSDEDAHAP